MTAAKYLVSALAVLLFALLATARAQTTPVEVAVEADRALFSAGGEVRRMQVEIYAPGGELLFTGEAIAGQPIEWAVRDASGRRVADGVYLAAVTVVDAAGKVTKRVEQVVVGGDAQAGQGFSAANASAPDPTSIGTITGEGTAGKIAKFTGANQIANSVIAESAGKIGVGTTVAPTATLQVNGAQPAPQPGTGTEATPLLQTTGGKGGNSTTAGEIAGKGASISLLAGNGGNTISGSTNGSGGSITLQGGSAGTGGSGGSSGNVLLAPVAGNVGIGTTTPTSKLTITGSTITNLVSIENTSTIAGSVALLVKGRRNAISGISGSGSGFESGVRGEGPYGVFGTTPTNGRAGVYGTASSTYGVQGKSVSYPGVYGESEGLNEGGVQGVNNTNSIFSKGVYGFSSKGYGVYGSSTTGYAGGFNGSIQVMGGAVYFGSETRQMINLYSPFYGIGVQNSTHYFRTNVGFAWYHRGLHTDTANSPGNGGTRLMKLDSAGNLTATSFNPTSDRAAKSNFSAINPRFILDKLKALPIQTWNYKADGNAIRHIGPVAQDFRAAFQLGTDDKTISTVDADGVTMAAVQGLYQMMLEKEKQLERQARQIDELQSKVMQLERTSRRGAGKGRRTRR